MKNPKCRYCKEEIQGNPRFIIKKSSMTGYDEVLLCTQKCFLMYLKEKYNLEKW